MIEHSKTQDKLTITPQPGYILVVPHPIDTIYGKRKDSSGEALISRVVRVGEKVKDTSGEWHSSPVEEGDIIVHAFNAKDFSIGADQYRGVHFTEVYHVITYEKHTEADEPKKKK